MQYTKPHTSIDNTLDQSTQKCVDATFVSTMKMDQHFGLSSIWD